jgi:ankyrin repeat protein
MSGFGPFGKALFCAAKSWDPPPPPRPLRSDGEVILAARKGDMAALRLAVSQGADINAPGRTGSTALHLAVMKGDVAIYDELMKLGADPLAMADRGMHALVMAVVHKAPLPLLERLAATRLDLTLTNADGFTALHAAAEVGNDGAVPWLVAHGLPLEARTKHGHSALHVACALGHAEATKALLLAGADVRATSPNGTPRDVAVAEKKPAIVALLDERV